MSVWTYMSSAIPKALFSMGLNAPAEIALLQSPSERLPGPFSKEERLENQDIEDESNIITS